MLAGCAELIIGAVIVFWSKAAIWNGTRRRRLQKHRRQMHETRQHVLTRMRTNAPAAMAAGAGPATEHCAQNHSAGA